MMFIDVRMIISSHLSQIDDFTDAPGFSFIDGVRHIDVPISRAAFRANFSLISQKPRTVNRPSSNAGIIPPVEAPTSGILKSIEASKDDGAKILDDCAAVVIYFSGFACSPT